MNRVFEPRGYFTVPDGTDVSAFLNATDLTQADVPWNAVGDMSIAQGRINPGVRSWVHVHHVVTQVTYLLAGELTVRMKEANTPEPYELVLKPGQAVLVQPGTLFQLQNEGNALAKVLYLVSPSYVSEVEGQEVRYDDATLVAKTWKEIVGADYDLPTINASASEAKLQRREAIRRIARRKGVLGR